MNGMHQEQAWAFSGDDDDFSLSFEFRLPPTPTLAQVTLGDYFEFDDKAHVDLGFTSCTFLDSGGVTRTDNFPDIDNFDHVHVFGRNRLASATYATRVANCAMSCVANFFFWDLVF